MRSGDGRRRGAVLLEALVAMTILGTAGVAAIGVAKESGDALRRARERESELRSASAFLDAVVLWTRADLDRHLGEREQGHWRLRIERPTTRLYVVTLSDSLGEHELFRTALFRPLGAP
jgi:type II secretory pathway pseudopilin PulG